MPAENYIHRINRVIDYIESRMGENFTLEDLAGIAHFSPYHFHRIFKAFTGETISNFIRRIRLEKAATNLLINPDTSVTEIMYDCGFSDSAHFARAFKDQFGMSASAWRKQKNSNMSQIESNNHQIHRNPGQESAEYSLYIDPVTNQPKWRIKMKTLTEPTVTPKEVRIENLDAITVAYVRHVGPYKGDSALFAGLFEKLMRWAGPRELIKFPETQCFSVYHDNPDITDDSKLRTSVCLSVPPETKVDGEIGKMEIPAGKYALARFEIDVSEYEQAWNAVYGGWLPTSGYQPADGPSFEWYRNNPEEHPEKKHIFDICLPVKPL